MTLTFTVLGKSQPQGSMRAFMPKNGRFPVVTSDNPNLKSWRQDVSAIALREMRARRVPKFSGPVRVCADFYLPCPKSKKPETAHVTKPDVDKLARGLCDAVKGIVWADDSQVTQLKVTKQYAAAGIPPCMVVSIQPVDAPLFAVSRKDSHVAASV